MSTHASLRKININIFSEKRSYLSFREAYYGNMERMENGE